MVWNGLLSEETARVPVEFPGLACAGEECGAVPNAADIKTLGNALLGMMRIAGVPGRSK